jgi:hypothetical protein
MPNYKTMSNLFFYSTNTLLAKVITERYFKGVFQIWAAPNFDNKHNPPSSNPKDIFLKLHKAVKNFDNHDHKMYEVKAGLLKVIQKKLEEGSISEKQYAEANDTVYKATITDFKPLLYVIPNNEEINQNIIDVEIEKRAAPLSEECVIKNLKNENFNILES